MMPKFTFIGWKSPTLPPETYRLQRAYRRLLREIHRLHAEYARRRLDADEHARCRGLHIALDAGHLPGKADASVCAQAVIPVKQLRAVEICIAVHDAVAHELRVLKRWDHGEHALLLAPCQVRLEADDVIDSAVGIVAPKLDDGIVFSLRCAGL